MKELAAARMSRKDAAQHREVHRDASTKRVHEAMNYSMLKDGDEVISILDEPWTPEKKKCKLTSQQIEFLESNFSIDLKLEHQRKAFIASHLGIQPRQVAIWFQNRRARWKNKQLEQDYEALKVKHEAMMKENLRLADANKTILADNKFLQDEVARLTRLLHGTKDDSVAATVSDNLGSMPTILEFTSLKQESVFTSPAKKSSYNQNRMQEKDCDCVIPKELVVEVPPMTIKEDSIMPRAAAVMVELEHSLVASDEFLESAFNPCYQLQLACNGVRLEDHMYSFLWSWENETADGFARTA